jgi:hypothetical protein
MQTLFTRNVTTALLAALCAVIAGVPGVMASVPPADGARVSILNSTPRQIVVELSVDDYEIETIQIDGAAFQRVHIPGLEFLEVAGAPQTPLAGAMVGIPSSEGVSIQMLDAEYETLSALRLAPAPRYLAPVLALADLSTGALQPSYAPDPAIYGQDAWYPQTPVELGMTGALRDQPVAQLQFYPVQYNPTAEEARIYRRIVAQISWPAGSPLGSPLGPAAAQADAPAGGRASSPAFERVLAETLLNYDQLARPQTGQTASSPAVVAASLDATTASTQTLKLYVDQDGIYQVTYDDLAAAGLAPDAIDPRNLKLTHQEVETPIYVAGQDDGQFNAEDYLLFYGTAITDVYTTENVYWLSEGNSAGQRMAQRNGAPGGAGPTPTRFRTLLHAEEDTVWWRIMPRGEGLDHWFWFDRISPSTGGLPVSRSYPVALNHISTEAGTAMVRVQLRGFTALAHRSKIYLNGTEIDDQTWEGQIVFTHEVEVDHALLQEGDNVVLVESVDAGASVDQYFVNWIELEYWDSYTADDDQLRFQAPSAGAYNFEVAGFSGEPLMTFDITDPSAPQMIANAVAAPEAGATTLKFRDAAGAATRYLALHSSQFKTPHAIVLEQPSAWKTPANGADYIVITHEEFYANTLPLADHRRNSGLRVAVVKVGDLYDEFNGGVFNPNAIRDFLRYAYQNWQAPAPTFVVLVGDATADYQDFQDSGTVNYVPTQIVDTEMFQALSDSWYAAVSGDDVLPDLFIGRLSAQNQAQVDDIVAKVIAYDQEPSVDSWNKNVLLIADDDERSFTELSEELASRLPYYYMVNRVYVDAYPPNNPTQVIAQQLTSGNVLVNYTGHGEYFRWGKWNNEQEFIWGLPDIEALQNEHRLPIVTVANCLNGYFADEQNRVSVAEAFQRQRTGGAIAILAPTSFGFPSTHRIFMNAFYDAIFQEDQLALGAATTTAMVNGLAQSFFLDEIVKTYILFGDPATQAVIPTNFPYVKGTWPADEAENVALDQTIQITFSKPISIATVVLGGSGAEGRVLTPTWSADATVVAFAHSGFARGQSYQLSITGEDLAGVPLGEGTAPTTWSFTTSDDVTPPTLTVDDPLSSGTSFTIQLHFSEPMRQESVVATLEPEVSEPLLLEWDDDGQTATSAVAQLQPGQTYTLRVTAGEDLAGNALAGPVEKSFTVTIQIFLPNVLSS